MAMNEKVNAGDSIDCHDNNMTIPCLPPLPVATSRRRGTAGAIATVTLSTTQSSNDTEMSNSSIVVNPNTSTNVDFNSSNDFTIPSLPILKSTRKVNTISSLDSINNTMNKENHNPTSVTSSEIHSTSSPIIKKSNGPSPNDQVKLSSSMPSKRLLSSPLHTSSISTSTPTTIQRRQKRVLRNGDTIESLFCLKKKTKTINNNKSSTAKTENCILFNTSKYYDKIKSLCNDIVNDIDNSSNDIKKWKEVLTFAYWNVHQYYCDDDGKGSTSSDDIEGDMGSNLIRLHRRATSRFSTNVTDEYKQQNPNYEKDLLAIWLQYVKVRYEFNKNEDGSLSSTTENDIRSTFQLLQNKKLGQLSAEYYVALADFETYICRSRKIELGVITNAREIIEAGIKIGAQPTQLLNDYIEKLENGTTTNVIETDEGSNKNLENNEVENKSAESSLVSVLRSRTKKRPLTSIRSKIRMKNGSTSSSSSLRMGGPPKRLESIDDDDVEDDEDDFDREDNFEDDLNDLDTKRPKIAYLEKNNEKITSEYRNFLEQWDPMKRSNSRNIPGVSEVSLKNNYKLSMDVIEENTKENQPTLTVGNNTASTGSRSHHSNQSNAELSLQSSVQSNITKKDDMTTNNNSGRTPQNDESIMEAPIQIDVTTHSSPSMTLPGVDVDFLSLIQEKKVVFVNNKKYLKLGVIGKGGSCKVYRSLTKELCTVAIKKVNLKGMTKKSIEGYANEIELLRRLRGNQSIVQLYDSEVDIKRKAIFLVMEAGEADLNHVVSILGIFYILMSVHHMDTNSYVYTCLILKLKDQATRNSLFGNNDLHMNFIRSIWQQMLSVVHCIHEENIIHGDLKVSSDR